jgi:hypothetical protein
MKKINDYNNQKLAYYNKMQESLKVYSECVSDESLDSTLRNFMGGESNLRLYIEALQHQDNGFDPSIFDGNFFQQSFPFWNSQRECSMQLSIPQDKNH